MFFPASPLSALHWESQWGNWWASVACYRSLRASDPHGQHKSQSLANMATHLIALSKVRCIHALCAGHRLFSRNAFIQVWLPPPLRRQALASAVAILGGSWVAWTLSQSNGFDSSLPSLPSLPMQTIKTRLWSCTSRSWGGNHCCRSQNTCSKVPGNSHWTWWTAVTSLNDTRPTRVNSNCQDHAVQPTHPLQHWQRNSTLRRVNGSTRSQEPIWNGLLYHGFTSFYKFKGTEAYDHGLGVRTWWHNCQLQGRCEVWCFQLPISTCFVLWSFGLPRYRQEWVFAVCVKLATRVSTVLAHCRLIALLSLPKPIMLCIFLLLLLTVYFSAAPVVAAVFVVIIIA